MFCHEGISNVWFVNWVDQRLYRLEPGGEPQPLTDEPAVPRGDRWADGEISPDGEWIVCVREQHAAEGGAAAVRNEIVRLAAHAPSTPEVLVTGVDGQDFARAEVAKDLNWIATVRQDWPTISTTLADIIDAHFAGTDPTESTVFVPAVLITAENAE